MRRWEPCTAGEDKSPGNALGGEESMAPHPASHTCSTAHMPAQGLDWGQQADAAQRHGLESCKLLPPRDGAQLPLATHAVRPARPRSASLGGTARPPQASPCYKGRGQYGGWDGGSICH